MYADEQSVYHRFFVFCFNDVVRACAIKRVEGWVRLASTHVHMGSAGAVARGACMHSELRGPSKRVYLRYADAHLSDMAGRP